MYILARVLGIRRPGALVAALAYSLSGFYVVSIVFPMIIAAAAWLPLELAMIELTIRQGKALGGRPATGGPFVIWSPRRARTLASVARTLRREARS